ncbi:putative metal-dependent hydrolase [Kibdelosporangium phytohabitans]|nr:putative metal-dependent hydrolase [Kibdelosporangium phytohabitans]
MPYGTEGVERQPEGISRTPEQTLVEAQQLLDEGKPFHAHEVFEDAWKAADGPERALWRGLAQIAVGMTHAARGNETGAEALIERGVNNIWPYEVDPPYGIDITGLLRWAANPSGVPRLRAPAA